MYEEYFDGEEPEHNIENINVKTLQLFKNPENTGVKRTITSLSWHPDGKYKIAASYSNMKFQPSSNTKLQNQSFIWDINNPNVPCDTIVPPSPIIKMQYNHKNTDQLAFGCYNGIVGLWDLR